MLIDISSVRKSDGSSLRIDSSFDLGELAPGFTDVRAEGEIRNTSGIVSMKLRISGVYTSVCDRCGNDAVLTIETEIDTVFEAEVGYGMSLARLVPFHHISAGLGESRDGRCVCGRTSDLELFEFLDERSVCVA